MTASDKQIILLNDGRLGHLRQSQALADAIVKRCRLDATQQYRQVTLSEVKQVDLDGSAQVLVIGCGRRSAKASRQLKQRFPAAFTVQILDPRWYRKAYDLLLIPHHDEVQGTNVLSIHGSLHGIDTAMLRDLNQTHNGSHSQQNPPISALLLGGHHQQNTALLAFAEQRLPDQATTVHISTGPRSGQLDWSGYPQLKQSAVRLEPGSGALGYYTLLATADSFFIAADSINQLNEVLAARHQQKVWLVTHGIQGRKKRFVEEILALKLAAKLQDFDQNTEQKLQCPWSNQLTDIVDQVLTRWQAE